MEILYIVVKVLSVYIYVGSQIRPVFIVYIWDRSTHLDGLI